MNKNENIIPITRGKEISIEDLIKKFKAKEEKLENLHQRFLNEIKWREKLLKEEEAKPLEKLNYDLIISLIDELENLHKNESELFDILLETNEYKNKLMEKHRDIQELSDLINEMTELESILKENKLENDKK